MNILGLHDGHNACAAVVRDGTVVACVQEERLSRKKNDVGYPRRAIEDCLRIAGLDAKDLDAVVYASLYMHHVDYLTDLEPWYCVGLENQREDSKRPKHYQKIIFEQRKQERIATACDHLGVAPERVSFVEHHQAHLAAALHTAPNAVDGRPILGLTCDGAGDNISGSVSVCRDGRIDRIAVIDRHASIGKVYSRVTMLMGMTPWEHEYKLMGMAPYADPARARKAADKLHELLTFSPDGLAFVQRGELSMNYCYEHLRDCFERVRFDTIAAAVQLFTEEMIERWVRNAIAATGIRDVVCGGGVFMNVKANLRLSQLAELDSLYVVPSCGDESLAFGAALDHYHRSVPGARRGAGVFANLYLGGGYTQAAEQIAIRSALKEDRIEVEPLADVDAKVVELLADGCAVARCRGRMEWGARALGNRSILASAHDYRIVDVLNRSIKQRDFWMPFAPSLLAEKADRYLTPSRNVSPFYMMVGYDSTSEGARDLAAATHPRDRTIRPQMVTREANPAYHRLIERFEQRTGRSGLLNTSFNLHGEPIVYGPAEAISVFLRSGLDHLALDGHLLSKVRRGS
jgi:carbamoyltransferase